MKIALVQIYRFAPEERLLRRMGALFLRRGYRMVLWTNREYGNAGLPALPLSRGAEDDVLFHLNTAFVLDSPGNHAWESFENRFQSRYGRLEPAYESFRCHRLSSAVFDQLKPSLFLCWSGMDPWFAIPKEMARERGIPVLIWEAGMLPQTLLLDGKGICSESQWVGTRFPQPSEKALTKARAFLRGWKECLLSDLKPASGSPAKTGRPRVLILGGMDVANGVVHAHAAVKGTLPGFMDGIDLAIKAAVSHHGETVYRPHPNEPSLPLRRLDGTSVEIDRSANLVDAILDADVVIGYGSKTDFLTMALGKPIIMAGIGIVTGKDCAYEATSPERLALTIAEACKSGRKEYHDQSYLSLVASMLEDGHYNRHPDGPCDNGIDELVRDALMYADPSLEGGDFMDLLAPTGLKWWHGSQSDFRLNRRCKVEAAGRDAFLASLRGMGADHLAILDFDHTLWLGNSTEQFIAAAEPRILGEIVDKVAQKSASLLENRLPLERDQLRVWLITLFIPWTWLLWRSKTAKAVARFWNTPIYDAACTSATRPPVIVSLGFQAIIAPLISARFAGTDPEKYPQLICSGIMGRGRSLRRIGKIAAIEARNPGMRWTDTFAVSDSAEDRELLMRAAKGYLVQWPEPDHTPRLGYFPFRYIGEGKYPGYGYLRNYILGRDLIVWIITFAVDPQSFAAALLLFISFHTIYEIGYYENDFIGSKREKNPSLSAKYNLFAGYRIEPFAWIGAVLFALPGCYLATGNITSSMLSWLFILLAVRALYAIYNRTDISNRPGIYVMLQFFKNFGGLVVLQSGGIGYSLALAHGFQHSATYISYRCGGDKEVMNRPHLLLATFILGCFFMIATGQDINIYVLALSLVWIFHFGMTEHESRFFQIRSYIRLARNALRKQR